MITWHPILLFREALPINHVMTMETIKYQPAAIPLFARDRFVCSLFSIYPNLLNSESYPSAKLLKKSDICVIIGSQNAGMRQVPLSAGIFV